MHFPVYRIIVPGFLVCLLAACAQIVPPQGGPKDITPPKLLSVTPQDSLLHQKPGRIELRFDEYITLNNPAGEIQVSPILPFPPDVSVVKRSVILKIPDSLLQENTTYRITFGKAIQDLNEGNPFTGYGYIFSTGDYFDSLNISGSVIDAATGLKDTGALLVLYNAEKSDSAFLREKPRYAVKADQQGNFRFEGLPEKSFKLFALHDANNNLIYDGAEEKIGFADSLVIPEVSYSRPLQISVYLPAADTPATAAPAESKTSPRGGRTPAPPASEGFVYKAEVDTADAKKRTKDILKPLQVSFSRPVSLVNPGRMSLSFDSSGITVEALFSADFDTAGKQVLSLNTLWKEDALYTLRLLKGFAVDTAGTEAMPSRYVFRTRRDEDYAKLQIHLPSGYYGDAFLFELLSGNDSVYRQPVTDTLIQFNRLVPGTYTLRVIFDKNKNGRWDPGDLWKKIQPEKVIPYRSIVELKAGWENRIDFEEPQTKSRNPESAADKKP